MQRETNDVAIKDFHIQILGSADDLNSLGSSIEDTERAVQVIEQAANRMDLKINVEKNKVMELLDNTHIGSFNLEKNNEFRYVATVFTGRER